MEQDTLLKEETFQETVVNRWQMHRAGILNFWYYDDEEFRLEDGRLILRGSNGSGKSVTMQSFLPLVLDGDKRPHRLDPFGSRDRRIEYYLLGEADSGHTDRTGYLWLEFYHPEKKLYKTIGIGLRARKGAAQVGFWGFMLQDGRRMNVDFWLYDRNLWLEQGQKVPMHRKALEERIGSGGQVVQEQAAYRDMVNKALFGFHEQDSFQDLLQLMLQLRSPKLSKDFKPSAIYDILTQALPPLLEEELSPLSEVMEDMDQISDRLEELELHRREMEKVQHAYDKYNRFLIHLHSEHLLNRHSAFKQSVQQVEAEEERRTAAESERDAADREWVHKSHRLQEVDAELEVLSRSEAIEKQRELESGEKQLAEAEKHGQITTQRIAQNRAKAKRLEAEVRTASDRLDRLSNEQEQLLEDLESMARETEFREHDVYHRSWMRGVPEDDGWRDGWRRDADVHKKALETALGVAQAEREAHRMVQEMEVQLGDVRKERDQAERERTEREREVEREKDALRDRIVQWQNELVLLPYGGDAVREALQALSELAPESRNYGKIKQSAVAAYDEKRGQLLQRAAELNQEKKKLQEEHERLRLEREEWLNSREPEPARSEGRKKSREGRKPGDGAPLYAVCEFQPHLSELARSRLEEAMEQAGLLDAWIAPGGNISVLADDEEEVWIKPDPQARSLTLANALIPVPSEESGLTAEDIDAVLRTFRWEEADHLAFGEAEETRSWFNAAGAFRMGSLVGQVSVKPRAEYIGLETRRRTRDLAIAKLEAEMAGCLEKADRTEAELEALRRDEAVLKTEMDTFPVDTALQEAFESLAHAAYRLEAVMRQEEKLQNRLKEKIGAWRMLQQQLIELTSGWSRLKRENELQEAIQVCIDYERCISELHSIWGRYRETIRLQDRMQAEHEEVLALLDHDEALEEELQERRRVLKAQVERLKQVIRELGIEDLHRQIAGLKSEKERLTQEIREARELRERANGLLAALTERLRHYREEMDKRKAAVEETLHQWHAEMKLALVRDWKEVYREQLDEAAVVRLAKEINKEYTSSFATRTLDAMKSNLLEEYNAVRHALADYVLELHVHEQSGRFTIVSMRDRMNPEPPWKLLEELNELETEQRSLLSEKDRELYEEIILRSVGKAIRQRIHRANEWVKQMNRLMGQRNTSSGLRLSLDWIPKPKQTEQQLDTEKLVELLLRDAHRLDDEEIENIIAHFRSRIIWAKQNAQQERESLRKHIYELLDYRAWFQFVLSYRKGEQNGYRELTDSRFNVLSGGEKAMAMYIPLFAATYSRYNDAHADAPKIISLDEAFAGVDEENMRDMFLLLTDMGFDYMMTSQVLWGCYDTVPRLAIYEIYRPKDVDFVTLFHYRWNGRRRELMEKQADMNVPG